MCNSFEKVVELHQDFRSMGMINLPVPHTRLFSKN